MITVTSVTQQEGRIIECKPELQIDGALCIKCDPLPRGMLSTEHKATSAACGGVRTEGRQHPQAVWGLVSDNPQRSCKASFGFVFPRGYITKPGRIRTGKAKGLTAPSVPAAD